MSSINATIPLPPNYGFVGSITGSGTAVVACSGAGTLRWTIRGTWTGTIVFESTLDAVTWLIYGAVPYSPLDPNISLALTAQTTVNGNWVTNAAGLHAFRVRCIGVTGTAEVIINSSAEPAVISTFLFVDGIPDSRNTTTTPLGAGATFTGITTDMIPFTSFRASIFTDQDSAFEGLEVQFSPDGVNWDIVQKLTVYANQPAVLAEERVARFYRFRYTNGATAQGVFRLHTTLQRGVTQLVRETLQGTVDPCRNVLLTRSCLSGFDETSNVFRNVLVSPQGRLSIEAMPGGGTRWTVTHAPAAGLVATATRAAAGPGVRNIAQTVTVSMVNGGGGTPLLFVLRDGATGVGPVLWTVRLVAPNNLGIPLALPGWWEGSLNTAMTLECTVAPGAGDFATVALSGTTM